MKALPIILPIILITSCGREKEAEAKIDPGSLEALEHLDLPELELDDVVLDLTQGYEHLRLFLYDELPPQVYEELFNDIFKTADRKQISERSVSGRWLNGLKIDQRGVGGCLCLVKKILLLFYRFNIHA